MTRLLRRHNEATEGDQSDTSIEYPNSSIASYTYDFADRPATLDVDALTVVTSSSYLPSGPLNSLQLASGVLETRGFDGAYFPSQIALSGAVLGTWDYTTDAVGNITEIDRISLCQNILTLRDVTLTGTQQIEACSEIFAEAGGSGVNIGDPADETITGDVIFDAPDQVGFEEFAVLSGSTFQARNAAVTAGGAETYTYTYQPHQ